MYVDTEKPASDLLGLGIKACRMRADDPPTHHLNVESNQKDNRGLAVVLVVASPTIFLVGIGNPDDAGSS